MKRLEIMACFGILIIAILAPAASATTSEVVWKEYPYLYKIGIGGAVYRTTYDNGDVGYQYVWGRFLRPASIVTMDSRIVVSVNVNPPPIKFQVKGDISPTMLGCSDPLNYKYELWRDSPDPGLRQTFPTPLYLGQTIDASFSGASFTAAGTYEYRLVEYAKACSVDTWVRGNTKYLTVIVGSESTPTPAPTIQPGQCMDSYGNLFPCTKPTPTPTSAQTPAPTSVSATSGTIIVWSYPSQAKVYVNDVENGTTGAQWLSIQMPVGTYTVKVVKDGYETYSQNVTVVANDNVKVEARMTAISPLGSTATGTPATTSGMTVETPAPKTTKGGYECPQGTVWNVDRTGCIVPKKTIGEKIDQLPGFEALFAIAGLVAVSYLVLRQEKKKKDDDEE